MYRRSTFNRATIKRYVDADYAGNINTRLSLFEYVFTLFRGTIYWKSSIQSFVTLSTTQKIYRPHRSSKGGIVIKGNDSRVGYYTRLCECLL